MSASAVRRFTAHVNSITGIENLPSDFACRNPWQECLDSSCQICKFIAELEDSVVCSISSEWRPRGLCKNVVHCRIVCHTARLVSSCVGSYKNRAPSPPANSFLPKSGHQIVREGLKSWRFSQWAFYRQTASISRGFSRQNPVCKGYNLKVKSILLSQPRTLRKWRANSYLVKKETTWK